LNTSPVVSPSDAFAVTPVVDYEPPTQDVARTECRQARQAPSRRRNGHAPHRSYTGQPSRQPAAESRATASAQMRQAAAFADAALRRVLEVIDRRRPAAQLRGLLAPSLVDSVVAVGHSPGRHAPGRENAAVLRRMRLQPAGRHDPDNAAEVFGSYSRGPRIHAIACRVEQVPTGTGPARWMVVALHIG
jgi:uncharacterized protein DUF6459